jgi:peptide/nickel transport system permease protein
MLRDNRALSIGLTLVALLFAAALAGALVPAEPPQILSRALAAPSEQHWFGCDPFGADLGARLLAGAWRSLRVATAVTGLTMAAGFAIGAAAAAASPAADAALMRAADLFLAFPGILLAILIASFMPHSEASVIFALAATGWAGRARFCRGLVRNVLARPYVEAASASGASLARLLRRHVLPNVTGQLLIQASLSMGGVILAEASLSFLGLGGALGNPSWGRLIAEGREYLVEAPHLSILPGIAFVLSVVGFNLLSEGLRIRLDPTTNHGLY